MNYAGTWRTRIWTSVEPTLKSCAQRTNTLTNAQEFAEVAEKHSGFVYNVAYRMMSNHHDAEEVAQDAFVSAYKARDRFRGDALPTTWLYRVTVNAALTRIRKDKRGREMTVSEDFRPDVASSNWSESPVAATMNSEFGSRIEDAIGRLPEDLRVAVILRDVQGLSNQEAADTLDVSVSALKARLHRERLALRDSLAHLTSPSGRLRVSTRLVRRAGSSNQKNHIRWGFAVSVFGPNREPLSRV